MENKKLALLYILEILREDSDVDHQLTQSEIAQKLELRYNLVLERKAISRNLGLLQAAGYEIGSSGKGVYLLERDFDPSELRLMIDGVLSSRYIPEHQAKDLANRIAALTSKHFRPHVRHIHLLSDYEKADNKSVFAALDRIDEAINEGRQISFDYADYGWNEQLKPTGSRRVTVSPIQLVVKNQFYYLIAVEEIKVLGAGNKKDPTVPDIQSFRLDRIFHPLVEEDAIIDPQRLKRYSLEQDVRTLLSTHPYMRFGSSDSVRASFLCLVSDLDLVTEDLGTDLRVEPYYEDLEKRLKIPMFNGTRSAAVRLVKVSLKIAYGELLEFACRYPSQIFLLSPEKAVEHQKRLYQAHLELAETIRALPK